MQMTEKEAFQKLVAATKTDTNPLDKQNIQKYLFSVMKQIESFIEPVKSLKKEEFNELRNYFFHMDEKQVPWKGKLKDILDRYNKYLQHPALDAERNQFYSSIIFTCEKVHQLLKDINMNIDVVLDADTIELTTLRASETAVLSILRDGDILSTWAMYVFSTLTMVRSNMSYVIPQYRFNYIADNVDKVIETVNNAYFNRLASHQIINKIKESRSNMTDQRLLGPTGVINKMFSSTFGKVFAFNSFVFFDFIVSMLRWPFEAWQDWLYKRYLRNIELKNWMEQHVALLRLEASQLATSDPKYTKIQKAIEIYDRKITEYSKKIEEFERDN